ncbi:MAG: hypothetical protein LBG58_04260 [Planctomycetaceae bacterium]|nr:hypothetical protein [Planctomycetaceae bacterium]
MGNLQSNYSVEEGKQCFTKGLSHHHCVADRQLAPVDGRFECCLPFG